MCLFGIYPRSSFKLEEIMNELFGSIITIILYAVLMYKLWSKYICDYNLPKLIKQPLIYKFEIFI